MEIMHEIIYTLHAKHNTFSGRPMPSNFPAFEMTFYVLKGNLLQYSIDLPNQIIITTKGLGIQITSDIRLFADYKFATWSIHCTI